MKRQRPASLLSSSRCPLPPSFHHRHHHSASAHPSHVSSPHRELHRRPKWLRPHASPTPISAHPHTFRGPIGSSTKPPVAGFTCGSPPTACPCMHAPHTIRGPAGSSTEGPGGRVRMRPQAARFVALLGAPPKAPVAGPACVPSSILARPSHASWALRELHQRLRWARPQGASASRRRTPDTLRGPRPHCPGLHPSRGALPMRRGPYLVSLQAA